LKEGVGEGGRETKRKRERDCLFTVDAHAAWTATEIKKQYLHVHRVKKLLAGLFRLKKSHKQKHNMA